MTRDPDWEGVYARLTDDAPYAPGNYTTLIVSFPDEWEYRVWLPLKAMRDFPELFREVMNMQVHLIDTKRKQFLETEE